MPQTNKNTLNEVVKEVVKEVSDEVSDEVADDENQYRAFTKPALTRLARRAGIKSMADDCIDPLRHLIAMKCDEIIYAASIVNSERNTVTLMPDDIYESLALTGMNVARTQEF